MRFIWLQTGSYSANDRSRVRSIARYTSKAAWAAARLRPRPDVIVASSPHPLAGLSAAGAARWLRIPWIFEARDIWPSALVDLGAVRRGSVTHRGLEMVERFDYRSSSRVVFVPPRGEIRLSELGIDDSQGRAYPKRGESVGGTASGARKPPAHARRMRGASSSSRTRGRWECPTELIRHSKACGDSRTAIRRAARDVALLLVGGGVYRDALVQQARDLGLDNVLFHEPIEKGAIGPVLARADACLMQTSASNHFRYGLSPNKLFDYLAAAKPVLISAEDPTIVDEVDAGIRYPPGDPDAFADALLRLMRTPLAEREAMGERGRELVRSRYSIAAIADQYERLLEEVVAERR